MNKKVICVISGSPEISVPDDFDFNDKTIICADGGYDSAVKLGIKPDFVIGDFDTSNTAENAECTVLKYKPEKDDTDTMLCVKYAIQLGADEIFIFNALGGQRFDHTFANIQTLNYIFAHGKTGYTVDKNNIITIQTELYKKYPKRDGYYFSVFSLAEKSIISLSGFKYSGENIELTDNFPLGVSNEITEETAEIELKKGKLLIMYSRKEKK